MAKVYVKFNSAVIKEVKLNKDEITFGRKPTNDIVIDHPTISGFHGKIKKEADKYVLEDLNSTNGTFVNGRRVKTADLKDHDQIGVAAHIFDFRMDDNSAAPLPTAPAESSAETEKQKEMLRKSLGIGSDGKSTPEGALADDGAPKNPAEVTGIIRIIAGGVDGQAEIQLKDLVTYIGTNDKAMIKIKGLLAPDLAAAISKRPEGFFLKAVKTGYPKVNGLAIREQIFLENGALIEVGGTNMIFYQSDAKKAGQEQDVK